MTARGQEVPVDSRTAGDEDTGYRIIVEPTAGGEAANNVLQFPGTVGRKQPARSYMYM